jgi:hypothetical protein
MCVLTLEGFSGLDTAVFSGMSSLRDLSLSRVTFVPAPAPGQLLFVSKLTALQSLSIKSSPIGQQDITAAEAAALTAPQQLTSLTVSGLGGKLQALQYSSMFPAGRRLSSLTGLQVGPSFLQDAAVVTQAAYCCVALTSLVLEWSSSGTAGAGAGPAAIPAVQLAAGVGALTCFGSLASLTLNAHHETLPGCIWGNLATLTDLRSLSVVSWRPDYGPVLALTRCQRLEKLTLEGWENEEVMAFECDIRLTSSTLDDKVSCA